MFRSKVLAARKAGYVQDIFSLIQDGVLDQINPKSTIQVPNSIVLFTESMALCFDFG